MNLSGWIGSSLLLTALGATAVGLESWKRESLAAEAASAAAQPAPVEAVLRAVVRERDHVRTTLSIGTVRALRSITLQNELPGTIAALHLRPGAVVEAGAILIELDVSVERAELRAQQAAARLAETLLGRVQRASTNRGASAADVDRAQAELDVARANVERIQAIIDRKTLRAPFRARVGLSDVHLGQYLNEGTPITTLQGVDDTVEIDFTVAQDVAAALRVGDEVEVLRTHRTRALGAQIVALDARVDRATRNAWVRARLESTHDVPAPGASVRVRVPTGAPEKALVIPVSALRRGPAGDHVFVLQAGESGSLRAQARRVESGPSLGDEVVILDGLTAGEEVAAAGSFKLHEGALVVVKGTWEATSASEGD
jgi:membrane fusion protein (multidrug efflux system)